MNEKVMFLAYRTDKAALAEATLAGRGMLIRLHRSKGAK